MRNVAFAAVKERRFVNRGFLNGPICPIYGVGVVMVVVFLEPFEDQWLLLYLASAVLVTLIEGMTGYVLDKLFHHKWWDYSELPLNIGGYVCLLFSVVWGVACVVIVKAVHPLVGDLCALIPLGAGILILSVLSAALAADLTVTVGGILRWNRQLDAMEKIAADLRELSGKMGENIYENVMDTMELREKVDAAVEKKDSSLRSKGSFWQRRKSRRQSSEESTKSWRSVHCGQEDICCVHFQSFSPDATRKFWNRSGKGSEQRAGIRACAGDKWISVLTEYRNPFMI